jgi:hypothetical protein
MCALNRGLSITVQALVFSRSRVNSASLSVSLNKAKIGVEPIFRMGNDQ